jgi:hypothetical protein
MPDTYGAIQLPIQAPAAGFPVSDPALKYLADFAKAVILAQCATAWDEVAPGEPIVREAFYYNPEFGGVNDADCPSLWVWRDKITREQLSADWLTRQTLWRFLWLLNPAEEGARLLQVPMHAGLDAALAHAFFWKRHVGWQVDGDTEEYAATRGSLINRWCCFTSMLFGDSGALTIDVQGAGGERFGFVGYGFELTSTERAGFTAADHYTYPTVINAKTGTAEGGVLPGNSFETEFTEPTS